MMDKLYSYLLISIRNNATVLAIIIILFWIAVCRVVHFMFF